MAFLFILKETIMLNKTETLVTIYVLFLKGTNSLSQ